MKQQENWKWKCKVDDHDLMKLKTNEGLYDKCLWLAILGASELYHLVGRDSSLGQSDALDIGRLLRECRL